jgi:hypothetical protein
LSEPEKNKPKRGPRKDRGTRRVSLPAWLVKDLEQLAKVEGHVSLEGLLVEVMAMVQRPAEAEPITLPPAVQARLAPAAEGSGRSVSDLLLMLEEPICDLLDGRLSQTVDGGMDYRLVPSLEDRLIENFRARIKAVLPAEPAAETDGEFSVAALRAGAWLPEGE